MILKWFLHRLKDRVLLFHILQKSPKPKNCVLKVMTYLKFVPFFTLVMNGVTNLSYLSKADEQWCTITLDKQKLRTKEISADVLWQEQLSMLVYSLQYDKVSIS